MEVPTIIVIDDDPAVLNACETLLNCQGFDVRCYSSADAFLDASNTPVDCIVTDFMMPGLSGIELICQLDERGIDAPVIIISGTESEPTIRHLSRRPVIVVEKPFDPRQFVSCIRESIARYRDGQPSGETSLRRLRRRSDVCTDVAE